jgi:hypothetical protein
MEHTHSTTSTDRPFRVPRLVWIVGGGLAVALAAIVVFNIPVNTVATVGFFVLMMGSHLFMHGGHGGHGDHSQHSNSSENAANTDSMPDVNGTVVTTQSPDQHTRHSGGCH